MFRKIIVFLSPISIFACGPTISGGVFFLFIPIFIVFTISLVIFLMVIVDFVVCQKIVDKKLLLYALPSILILAFYIYSS
jgi:hypothetical protein